MKHVAVLVLALVAGCMNSHSGTQALAKTDCYTCHQPDYEGTPQAASADPAVPDHLANQMTYTTACADCHITTTWFSHPEKLFNVASGPHASIACNSCHVDSTNNSGDARGANTLCTSCHPASQPIGAGTMTTGHSDVAAFSYTTPPAGFTANNFCLSCHPDGREKPHDDTIFPQDHGNARNCDSCHDRSLGSDQMGQNAKCTRCHPNAHNQDQGVPSGCLQRGCHYGGRGGGD